MSSTQEFYIRAAQDTEARGPFSLDQLASLIESGQADMETHYYDANAEQWLAIGSSPELKARLFPEKKKLQIKPKERVQTLNIQKEEDAAITVQDMLDAAEGRTAETKGKADPMIIMERCASIGCWVGCATCLITAGTLLLSNIELVQDFDYGKIFTHPLTALGAIDFFLFLILALKATTLYPFIRFRAMFGIGMLGLIFWIMGDFNAVAAVVAASFGLYLSTTTINYGMLIGATILALGGSLRLAQLLLLT